MVSTLAPTRHNVASPSATVESSQSGQPYKPALSVDFDNTDEEAFLHEMHLGGLQPAHQQRVCMGKMCLSVVASLVIACLSSGLILRWHGTVWGSTTKLASTPKLQFRRTGTPLSPESQLQNGSESSIGKFKILQIADIHLGEAEDTLWGPNQDQKTWKVIDTVLSLEEPDLIVLSGDQLTANDCQSNATAYYQMLGEFLSEYEIPWALIFGNHDDTSFENKDGKRYPAKFLRPDLLRVDQSFPLSLSQAGPPGIAGVSNYVLTVNIGNQAAAEIYLLDSGGGSLPKLIDRSQIDWLRQHASLSNLPAVAFQHIPTLSHHYSTTTANGLCQGYHGEGIAPLDRDDGIMEALAEIGRFSFLAAGHNHGNDYCCQYQQSPLYACFGRHSGYGGYGRWARGARVYELTLTIDSEARHVMQWESWVRTEHGYITDRVHFER